MIKIGSTILHIPINKIERTMQSVEFKTFLYNERFIFKAKQLQTKYNSLLLSFFQNII